MRRRVHISRALCPMAGLASKPPSRRGEELRCACACQIGLRHFSRYRLLAPPLACLWSLLANSWDLGACRVGFPGEGCVGGAGYCRCNQQLPLYKIATCERCYLPNLQFATGLTAPGKKPGSGEGRSRLIPPDRRPGPASQRRGGGSPREESGAVIGGCVPGAEAPQRGFAGCRVCCLVTCGASVRPCCLSGSRELDKGIPEGPGTSYERWCAQETPGYLDDVYIRRPCVYYRLAGHDAGSLSSEEAEK